MKRKGIVIFYLFFYVFLLSVDISDDRAFKIPNYALTLLKFFHAGFLILAIAYFYNIELYKKYNFINIFIKIFLVFLVGLDISLWYYGLFVIYKFTAIQIITSTLAQLIMYAPSWYLTSTLIHEKRSIGVDETD